MVVNGHFSRGREGGALVVEVGPKSLFIISDNFSFTALLTLPTTSTIHHHLMSLFHQPRIGAFETFDNCRQPQANRGYHRFAKELGAVGAILGHWGFSSQIQPCQKKSPI